MKALDVASQDGKNITKIIALGIVIINQLNIEKKTFIIDGPSFPCIYQRNIYFKVFSKIDRFTFLLMENLYHEIACTI